MTIFSFFYDLNHVLKICFLIVLVSYKIRFMKKVITALSLFFMALPNIVLAHPGHGETEGFTITHYFIEPVHAIVSIVIVAALVVYIRHLKRNRQTK